MNADSREFSQPPTRIFSVTQAENMPTRFAEPFELVFGIAPAFASPGGIGTCEHETT